MTEIEKLRDEVEFYKRREADICAAVGGVADGGQYRADIIAAIVNLRNRERDAVLRLLRAKMEHYEKGAGAAVGADARAECRAKAAVLSDVAEIVERGDHLTGETT